MMLVEEELARLSPDKDTLVTIGVFDGVHLGHKHLISQLVGKAEQENLLSVVVTFRRHPQEVLHPDTRLPFLTSLAEREKLLKNEGVDIIIPLTFTAETSRLSARDFIGLLRKHLGMRGMVIGPDFALGKKREGNADALGKLGREMGFSVTVVPPVMIDGEIVSSTAIRKALSDGDVHRVRRLVGRGFSLRGPVVAGAGRGVALGFPTANLDFGPEQALPADGVYASWVSIKSKIFPAMTNIGTNPTFGDKRRAVEVYVVDYRGDLYGKEIQVEFVERLREEKRFDNAEELKKQMAEDVKKGISLLSAKGGN
ncbi:MAG: bifunctional riboflavin kinase/FAD synthetase [Chloroflexi bacterium]|nr:bifunctional riboflavin kinase/FAD synthetase [Chloroflexota bacterium]